MGLACRITAGWEAAARRRLPFVVPPLQGTSGPAAVKTAGPGGSPAAFAAAGQGGPAAVETAAGPGRPGAAGIAAAPGGSPAAVETAGD